MKQKLLKILALTAMGLSLVSCGDAGSTSEAGSSEAGSSEAESEVEVVPVTAAGLMSLASDGSWEYLGQRVAISDSMTVGGHYGNTYFTTITDPGDGRVYGVEVEAEDPGFEGSGYGAAVYVEGTVTDVNGRMVLTDSEITIIQERQYDEDGNRISGTGGSVYYYSGWGRASWDATLNRTYSSILYEDTYALVTVPGTVTAGSEAYFYVNFPGEDPDTDFSTNTSLIRVTIPAGLSEDAVSNINTFFADYEAGDFIDLTCYWQYDSVANYGMGLILDDYWSSESMGLYEGTAEVYSTFAEAAASVQDYYNDEIPDCGSESAFSWTVDDYAGDGYTVSDLYSSYLVTNPDECSLTIFTANAKEADVMTVVDDIVTALTDAGYEFIYTYDTAGYYYGSLTVDEVVVSQVLIEPSTTYVYFEYVAELAPSQTIWDNETDAFAYYNSCLSALNASYGSSYFPASTALPGLAASGVATFTSIEYFDSTSYISSYGYAIYLAGFDIYFDSSVDTDAQAAAYIVALESAGFVYSTNGVFSSYPTGYFSSTTGEFVQVVSYPSYGVVEIVIYVMPAYAGYITAVETTTESAAE